MRSFIRQACVASLLIGSLLVAATAHAEDILFFGNSFTSSNDIPKMVEVIATSKGKTAATKAVTKGGQGFSYHLSKPATDEALQSKSWNWVVLQDQSLNPTHVGKSDFMKTGQELAQRVAKLSPKANLVLYETWAYSPKHAIFSSTSKDKAAFANPDEMYAELHKSYAGLHDALKAPASQQQVLVAPVGAAFARCVKEHPEIQIYGGDHKHPSLAGSYLSAAVIYATLFNDSPIGAAPGKKVDPQEAKILQEVAEKTVAELRAQK